MLTEAGHELEASILIPVEFHRGQAVACIRAWADEQDCPPESYQLIVCAPDTLDRETEREIRQALRPWDRFQQDTSRHDMPLVAVAARQSTCDLLIFTESHCLPAANALSTLLGIAAQNQEWAGFSCPTTPVVHNLLSQVEAEIYASHIQRELESAGWLKVLDQCFVVRREAYFAAGGFRPEFGHFAEWLLAAEMHRRGLVVGMHPTRVLRHHYVGDVPELGAFTLDFAYGQIKYLAECRNEPTSVYFSNIPELDEFLQRTRNDDRRMFRLKARVLREALARRLPWREQQGDRHLRLRFLWHDCVSAAVQGWLPGMAERFAKKQARCAERRLSKAIDDEDSHGAKNAFVAWFGSLVALSRQRFLRDNPALRATFSRNVDFSPTGVWFPDAAAPVGQGVELLGFYESEKIQDEVRIRWSHVAASVWLPLPPGRCTLVMEWHETRALRPDEGLRVDFEGVDIPCTGVKLEAHRLVVEVTVDSARWCRLDFSMLPFPAPGDPRLLGLPVTAIRWTCSL